MTFAYHANALAFGGRIDWPGSTIIPSQACAVLAPGGGEAFQTVRNFDYQGIITFDEASVYVGGSQQGTVRNTIATVSIRNLNILNMLHIDLLYGRVSSRHEEGEEEGEITFEGSMIENMRIAGKPVDVRLDHSLFSLYPKHAEFTAALSGTAADHLRRRAVASGVPQTGDAPNGTLATLLCDRFCWPRDTNGSAPSTNSGVIRCSLVESIPEIPVVVPVDPVVAASDTSAAAQAAAKAAAEAVRRNSPVRRHGYNVHIEGFGSVAVAEVIVQPNQRRVNMLRLNLGSPNGGDGTVAAVETNGTDMFP